MDALTIISSVGLSGLLTSALIFLTKSWITEKIKNDIKYQYDQKLETYKAELKREHDREIEQLKTQLQIAAAERSIRLTRVFDTIAEAVAMTYAKLLVFQKAVEDYTHQHSDSARSQALEKSIQTKWADVLDYFLPRKIYFPRETAKRIIEFINSLQSASGKFGMILAAQEYGITKPAIMEKLNQHFDEANKEMSELLALLEKDFQTILGLEESKLSGDQIAS